MQQYPIHPTLRHPFTHEPLQAVGWFRGRPIWPVMGGDDSVEPDDGGADGNLDQGDLDWGLDDDENDEDSVDDPDEEEFDRARALQLIKKQRESEKKLKAELRDLKKTSTAQATAAQEAAIKAAQEAQAEQTRKLGVALGFITEQEAADSTTGTETLLAEFQKRLEASEAKAAASEAKAAAAAQRDAIRDGAAKAGADVDALLDSNAFLKSLDGLDPNAQGYVTRVAKAVAEAVEKNPRLRADKGDTGKPTAGRSGAEITGQPPRKRERATGLTAAVSAALRGPS